MVGLGLPDRFPEGAAKGHPQARISLTLYRLEDVMNGNLDEVIDALITADRAAKLESTIEG